MIGIKKLEKEKMYLSLFVEYYVLSFFSLHIICLNSSLDSLPSPSLSFLANTAVT